MNRFQRKSPPSTIQIGDGEDAHLCQISDTCGLDVKDIWNFDHYLATLVTTLVCSMSSIISLSQISNSVQTICASLFPYFILFFQTWSLQIFFPYGFSRFNIFPNIITKTLYKKSYFSSCKQGSKYNFFMRIYQ